MSQNEMTPATLQRAGVGTDGDQYPKSTASADVALLDSMPREQQELAVTMMLDQAKQWLDRAMEATSPALAVSEFKAFVATVAEAARQKKLSEGIQLDAVEMVRRSERALGVAIRKGQDAGEIARSGQGASGVPNGATQARRDSTLLGTRDFFAHGTERADTYDMTDDVTDEEFETALTEAKAEGNLSRSNVVRKIKNLAPRADGISPKTPEFRESKTAWFEALAKKHPTAAHAFEAEGHTEHDNVDAFKGAAKRYGVTWRFDDKQWKAHVLKSQDLLERASLSIAAALSALDLIDFETITPEQADEALQRIALSTLKTHAHALQRRANR